jgi:hypothetical protein
MGNCDLPHTFSGTLFHMNPDGTGQRELHGSGACWPNRIFYARPIPGHPSRFVGIVKGHHDEGSCGNMVIFDSDRGRRQTDAAVQRMPGYGKGPPTPGSSATCMGTWPNGRYRHTPYLYRDDDGRNSGAREGRTSDTSLSTRRGVPWKLVAWDGSGGTASADEGLTGGL